MADISNAAQILHGSEQATSQEGAGHVFGSGGDVMSIDFAPMVPWLMRGLGLVYLAGLIVCFAPLGALTALPSEIRFTVVAAMGVITPVLAWFAISSIRGK